jgi:hypothetical protein
MRRNSYFHSLLVATLDANTSQLPPTMVGLLVRIISAESEWSSSVKKGRECLAPSEDNQDKGPQRKNEGLSIFTQSNSLP